MNHSQRILSLNLADESGTQNLGSALARSLTTGMRVYLHGQLGAGKTTLVRAMLRSLGYQGQVKSPTYTLVEPYNISSLYLYHFDFYRFRSPNEWIDSGFRELFDGRGVCLVEWSENAENLLPQADLDIAIDLVGEGRHVLLSANSPLGEKCIAALTLQKSLH